MTRVNLMLAIALLLSSLYLVRVSYDERRLYAALDRAQSQQRQLETEYGRLQAELQTQSTPTRIDKTARDKLRMVPATPAIVTTVTLSDASASGLGAEGASTTSPAPSAASESAATASQRQP